MTNAFTRESVFGITEHEVTTVHAASLLVGCAVSSFLHSVHLLVRRRVAADSTDVLPASSVRYNFRYG